MRAVVVTSNPATTLSDPTSPAGVLNDLGCDVVAIGFDVDTLPEDIELKRPSVVIVDAGAHLEVGRASIRRIREVASLADLPVLLCVEISRLTGLDTDVGTDDFVVVPIVAPELYARIRQLDWRMASFRAVFSREQLLSRVWGYRYAGGTRTVDIHIRRLRAKLGPGSVMIETVRHVGYKMRGPGTLGE